MDNVRTVLADLPNTVGGYTIAQDGYYTIVLNQNLCFERNKETYYHELFHINNGDFEKRLGVGLIEIYAHK